MEPVQPHLSINPEASATIVLIHGALSSSSDWDLVTPHLREHYHLLIPDLPGHGKDSSTTFNVQAFSIVLARLIRVCARNARAHVVGFSLGSIVAAHLASHEPDVVETTLVSGYIRLAPSLTTNLLPYFFGVQHAVTSLMPRSVLRYAMDGADIQASSKWSSKLCREISTAIVSAEQPEPIPSRTLVIAATKGGLIPSNDRIEDAKRLGEAARKANSQSRVVEHRGMRHPWVRQDPVLFAKTVRAWIEGSDLPPGFLDL